MNQQHTEISHIGEFGLIERIEKIVQSQVGLAGTRDDLIKGISDDAAVYRPTPRLVELLTTDALVEGVHFDLTFTSMKHLGWKAIVASLSDIAAMGGIPKYATITICLPNKISVEMIEECYEGAALACKNYSCRIIGGDTTATQGAMVISVTMVGEAEEPRVIYRSGAQPGDYVCVSGHLGSSVAGLKILLREKEEFLNANNQQAFTPRLEAYTAAIGKHLMPKPRLDLAKIFSHQVHVHSMIDISDGLASEIHHLCANSDVGATVFEHNIPVDAITQNIAAELSTSPTDYALYGGEEYELLFTLSETEYKKLEELTGDVTIIGRITEQDRGIELVRENGEREQLTAHGWDHFSR
jgi:thiamine-monophosphate kinase